LSEDKPSIELSPNASRALEEIKSYQELARDWSKIDILKEFLKIEDKLVKVCGKALTIPSIALHTEYPNANYTKMMVRNEVWRQSYKEIFHTNDIDQEQLVGFHDFWVMLAMISHKRKRPTEIINGVRNESALTEVIPQPNRKKAFFGMGK
jgi:hypothetical protein